MTTSWGDASAMLAAAGVREDTTYYRQFTAADQRAVLTVPMRIQAAWAANDPDAFAGAFADNGSLLMRDTQLTSREEIRTYMADGFSGPLKGARVKGWPVEVTFLSDRVALVVTEGGILYADDQDLREENYIRSTWVIVREPDGQLRLLSHQSSPVKS